MTLTARPDNKADRRLHRDSPHAADHEASLGRAMSRGIQPKGLDALVTWFREACHDEAPVTIHKNELWRDHGHDGSGGSALGTPAWSDPFRRFLEGLDHPSATDADGRYRLPLRAALSRMERRHEMMARMLYQLALLDGDWRRLADHMSYPADMVEYAMRSALHDLWREYSAMKLHIA